jgi:penicillin-binding protein 2
VIVENGGHGGATAAPIAKKIMDAWLLPQLRKATPLTANQGGSR